MLTSQASAYPYFHAPFLALAHRGGFVAGETEGRENTLAAFERAVSLGYRYCETDVHATRDGHLVAFHDDHLDRVSDGTGAIADLDLAAVRSVRVGGDAVVPTLDELLEALPDTRFNIDIKAPGAVDPLAETLRRQGAEQRVCVGSFSDQRLRRFRDRTRGRVATSCAPAETAVAVAASRGPRSLLGALSSPGVAFQVPVSHTVGGVRVPVVTPRFVNAAHVAGRQVHVWTINDADQMRHLIRMGVDGLVSDDVVTLREVLIDEGLWA